MKRCRTALAAILLLLAPAPAPRAEEGGAAVNRLLRLWIPATLELCGEPVPLDHEDVADRLDLELVVALGDPVSATLWFKRAPRYIPLIDRIIAERGVPPDLKYVALIESNLRPDAVSRAGAAGAWQFMPATGRMYGLRRLGWRDDRRTWEKATRAAVDHLADLRERFGSWALALAAYNAGSARVSRAMEAQGQDDFYGLRLPRETERYVFRVMAAKLLFEHPGAYGIDLEGARLFDVSETTVVELEIDRRRLPVAAVAEAAGTSYRGLVRENPWIVGPALPRGTHRLRIPKAGADGFETRLARWSEANPEPRQVYYRVRRGDTLSGIARKHNVALRQLCEWNGLTTRSIIRPGQTLVVQLTN